MRWQVRVTRTTVEEATVEVEADGWEEAEDDVRKHMVFEGLNWESDGAEIDFETEEI